MGHHEHRKLAPESIRIAVVTVSSSRSLAEDESGRWIVSQAENRGYRIVAHQVVKDDIDAIREQMRTLLTDSNPNAVIVTGGTGITPNDVTIEAMRPMFSKELSAFGPLFTQLSYSEINSAAIMSRATAGVIGTMLAFCIPGSKRACQLACDKLIFPELGHLVFHAATE